MERIIYFDYSAVIIFLMLLFSVSSRKMMSGKSNRIYAFLLSVATISAVADMLSVSIDNAGDADLTWLNFIFNTIYLVFHNFTTPAYIIYLVALVDTRFKFKKYMALHIISMVPFGLVVSVAVINFFNHKLFYFNAENNYTRGEWFPILYISAVFYMIYALAYLIKHRKLFNTVKFLMLLAILPICTAAVAIQFFFPQLIIESFCTAIGMMFISMVVRRPEEFIDVSTGTENYNSYAEEMKRSFSNKKPMDVILINTANYSSLSEILGYDDRNRMLANIADELMAINKKIRSKADIFHLDSGCFRFVLDRSYNIDAAQTAAAINEALKKVLNLNHMEINLVCYVCIANCPEDIEDFDTLIEFGNDLCTKYEYTGEVMYAADIMLKKRYNIMREIDSVIERALMNGNFSVYYQPIYSVKEKKFRSAEALLRLNDPKYGFVPPDLFIPAAEKSGVINQIGAYVLEEVCRFISGSGFQRLGLEYIEINLSVVQCMQSGLADEIMGILDRYKVPPEMVNLEITETAADYDQNIMTENLGRLSAAGIAFSLDDFGTGYSNMRRMAMLPLKIVKLDKAFIDTEDNPKLRIVLENTIKMLKAMEMEIVVEGVETESRLRQFIELDCDYIQGYYFSKPIPEEEFVRFIIER